MKEKDFMRKKLNDLIDETITTEEEALQTIKEAPLGLRFVPKALKTAKVCLAAVKCSGFYLKYVPKELKTEDLCLLAVLDDGRALEHVPGKFKTPELCLLAVENDGSALEHVPRKLKTPELCLFAVRKYWLALKFVPIEYQTVELCLIAVKKEKWAIKFVPKEIRATDPCFSSVELKKHRKKRKSIVKREKTTTKKNDMKIMALAGKIDSEEKALDFVRKKPEYFLQIPEQWRTKEVCLAAITSFGMPCAEVPAELQSEEFFLEAVRINTNGKALKYIPEEFRTMDVCSEAIRKFPEALEYVPETLKTSEMCLAAVQRNCMLLKYIPEDLKTLEICLIAVRESPDTLRYVPEKPIMKELCLAAELKSTRWNLLDIPEYFMTTELCLRVVRDRGRDLEYLPDKQKTEPICLAAVQKDGLALYHVPKNIITAELCMTAVKKNGMALEHVPVELKTTELCLAAVKKNGMALKFVPDKIINAELCLAAVNKKGEALQFVPLIHKTQELCITAVQKDSNSFKFVPEKIKIAKSFIGAWKNGAKVLHTSNNRMIILKPIFTSEDFGKDLIFINCTLGYDGNVNLLFADKKYDYQKKGKREWTLVRSFSQDVKYFQIIPETPQNYRLIIPETKKVIELNNRSINYTHGIQIDKNTFCFACKSTSDFIKNKLDKNCHIFDDKGSMLNEFYIGKGVKRIQTAGKNRMWVSYDDVGSTSNKNDFGASALVCIDDSGEVFHRYGLGMVECECFNAVSEHDLVVNTYPAESPYWYAYAKITSGVLEKKVPCNQSARFIASWNNLIVSVHSAYNSPDQDFSLVDIDKPDEKMAAFEFFSINGEKLTCVHAQKDTIFFWKNKMLYKVSIDELL